MCTVGAAPIVPFVLWDYDLDGEQEADAIEKLRVLKDEMGAYHWQIRKTKNGLHLVIRCDTWDIAQDRLYLLKRKTHKVSIMSCRKQRLRISPKWDTITGAVISPAPTVIDGCPHTEMCDLENDRTLTRLEFYMTYDKTIGTREWKPDELVLKSRGGEQIG